MGVVWCQIEVPAMGPSLDQRNPAECDVSLCVIKNEAVLACVGLLRKRERIHDIGVQ